MNKEIIKNNLDIISKLYCLSCLNYDKYKGCLVSDSNNCEMIRIKNNILMELKR